MRAAVVSVILNGGPVVMRQQTRCAVETLGPLLLHLCQQVCPQQYEQYVEPLVLPLTWQHACEIVHGVIDVTGEPDSGWPPPASLHAQW